jgi:hypothetical protein
MLIPSFRSRSPIRVYPRPGRGNRALSPALALALLALAGCGGGGSKPAALQQVSAYGARFSVPSGWRVTRTATTVSAAPAGKTDELVSVSLFRLLRPYKPDLWARVVPELDRAAGQLARQLSASLTASHTVTVAGGRAREYALSFQRQGHTVRERITFVLRDQREYELLCRWRSSDEEPAACPLLVSSFRPPA